MTSAKAFILFVLISLAGAKSLRQLCGHFDNAELTVFGTGERVPWNAALRTTTQKHLQEAEEAKAKIAEGHDVFPGIDQSQELTTAEGTFRVVVRRELATHATLWELEARQALHGKAFLPRFFGCQFDVAERVVFLVQEDTSDLPQLSSLEDKRRFQQLSKAERLEFYEQLFQAVEAIGESQFVHAALQPLSLTYRSTGFGELTLLFRDFSFVPLGASPFDFARNERFWGDWAFATTHKVGPMDNAFAAAVTVAELENKSDESLFQRASKAGEDLFFFKNPEQLQAYLREAAAVLDQSNFGKVDPAKVAELEVNSLSVLVLGLIGGHSQLSSLPRVMEALRTVSANESVLQRHRSFSQMPDGEDHLVIRPRFRSDFDGSEQPGRQEGRIRI